MSGVMILYTMSNSVSYLMKCLDQCLQMFQKDIIQS